MNAAVGLTEVRVPDMGNFKDVAVIDVLLTTVTPVAAVPPRLTVAPARNPVPVIVTGVPPLAGPELGAIELTVGAGFPYL